MNEAPQCGWQALPEEGRDGTVFGACWCLTFASLSLNQAPSGALGPVEEEPGSAQHLL